MKKVKFRRFTSKQEPCALPQWIHDQLDEFEENLPCDPSLPSPNEIIVKAIEDKGYDRNELCRRMKMPLQITDPVDKWLDDKGCEKNEITPELIDKALASNLMEEWLALRFLNALDIEREKYDQAAMVYWEKTGGKEPRILQELKRYRCYGPFVHALIKPSKTMPLYVRSNDLGLIKPIEMDDEDTFDPPSAEQIAYTISRTQKTFISKTTRARFDIGGYRYYRLPNEVYHFDLEGKLFAAGKIYMDPPPEFVSLRATSPGRFIRTEKPREIIAKIKQRNQSDASSKMK